MIQPLRRRHRLFWLLLAALLPLLYVAIVLSLPREPRIEALPEVLRAPLDGARPAPGAPR